MYGLKSSIKFDLQFSIEFRNKYRVFCIAIYYENSCISGKHLESVRQKICKSKVQKLLQINGCRQERRARESNIREADGKPNNCPPPSLSGTGINLRNYRHEHFAKGKTFPQVLDARPFQQWRCPDHSAAVWLETVWICSQHVEPSRVCMITTLTRTDHSSTSRSQLKASQLP